MRVFTTFDELAAAVGEDLGTTDWLEVTQERVDAFAEATDDHQWIHVDVERAKAGPFGGTIAHGYLTLAADPALQRPAVRARDARGPAQLRRQQGAVPEPGQGRRRGSGPPRGSSPSPTCRAGKQLVTRYTVEIEGQPKPACVAETVALLLP